MKQLKIALICKNENSKKRDDRNMGYFSYDVPEFTWEHFTPGKNFRISLLDLKSQGFDLVFHEDYPYGDYTGVNIPVVFLSIDSTLTEDHYKARLNQALKSDLVLVDHDDINHFMIGGINTYQFPYCVNDKVFYRDDTTDRTTDISYHCSSSAHAGIEERKRIRQLLHDISQKHNWVYRSGVLDIHDYANSFRNSKIVVNQSRTPNNRPHRIFDAMACGAMMLTSKLPNIKEDQLINSLVNHCVFFDDKHLEDGLIELLEDDRLIQVIADNGYNLVMQNHTWSIRAKQLREIINKEFGI